MSNRNRRLSQLVRQNPLINITKSGLVQCCLLSRVFSILNFDKEITYFNKFGLSIKLLNGLAHSLTEPAIIWKNDDIFWCYNGEFHNEYGPAIITDGHQLYCSFGTLHNQNGPAVIYPDGSVAYYYEGQKHRKGGPAVIMADGEQQYWDEGFYIKTVYPKYRSLNDPWN